MVRGLLFVLLLSGLVSLAGCNSGPERDPVVGEAFVGPTTLQLRKELIARAPLVATLHHGDRLDVIGRRRRFVKVRTKADVEGWTDSRLLLTTADMDGLHELADRAKQTPGQGKATVFDPLNVHTVPNRQAPSFFQIAANQPVEVVAYQRLPRLPFDPPEFGESKLIAQQDRLRRLKKGRKEEKEKESSRIPPPPPGKAPAVPENWLELSGVNEQTLARPQGDPTEPPPGAPPPPLDDWALVRTADGHAGWVLTRMLYMSIPDEVAQYAERARIVTYAALGNIDDHGLIKPVWLWTTLAHPQGDEQFDSVRVFVWSTRRHRYETSYIERGIAGYTPVLIRDAQAGGFRGFSLLVQDKGSLIRRDYGWSGGRIRVQQRTPATLPEPWYTPPSKNAGANQQSASPPSPEGLKKRALSWWRKLVTKAKP